MACHNCNSSLFISDIIMQWLSNIMINATLEKTYCVKMRSLTFEAQQPNLRSFNIHKTLNGIKYNIKQHISQE